MALRACPRACPGKVEADPHQRRSCQRATGSVKTQEGLLDDNRTVLSKRRREACPPRRPPGSTSSGSASRESGGHSCQIRASLGAGLNVPEVLRTYFRVGFLGI
mmetsp:Transcript_12676/g.27455  ORF Transcript_12676/g.27455 Transcript_12676/m.27455 type:complete len:104 (+) Transcript_12676:775-1086(+)